MGLFRRRWPHQAWALDLESTGLDPTHDEILSLGMVPIRDDVIHWGERVYRRIRPRRDAADAAGPAVLVHQLLPDESQGEALIETLVPELAILWADAALIVHWSHLDIGLLRRAFRQAGTPWPRPRIVDTIDLLNRLDRRRRLVEPFAEATPTTLDTARETLGLPRFRAHHALYDALATAELYLLLKARLGG
jgi:DNA polymerase-3 subunit epsilon